MACSGTAAETNDDEQIAEAGVVTPDVTAPALNRTGSTIGDLAVVPEDKETTTAENEAPAEVCR